MDAVPALRWSGVVVELLAYHYCVYLCDGFRVVVAVVLVKPSKVYWDIDFADRVILLCDWLFGCVGGTEDNFLDCIYHGGCVEESRCSTTGDLLDWFVLGPVSFVYRCGSGEGVLIFRRARG